MNKSNCEDNVNVTCYKRFRIFVYTSEMSGFSNALHLSKNMLNISQFNFSSNVYLCGGNIQLYLQCGVYILNCFDYLSNQTLNLQCDPHLDIYHKHFKHRN